MAGRKKSLARKSTTRGPRVRRGARAGPTEARGSVESYGGGYEGSENFSQILAFHHLGWYRVV